MNAIEHKLRDLAPVVLGGSPVLFAYLYGSYAKKRPHPFSDLDIGIYIEPIDLKECLNLELSLALRFDEQLHHQIQSEVRVLNHLPLTLKGRILGESRLIYTRDEEQRVAFETMVRCAYFDFLPVIHRNRHAFRQKAIAESRHGITR